MMLLDCQEARGRVFNIGSSAEISILELGRRILRSTGSSSRMVLVPYQDAYGEEFEELGRRRPNTAALELLTGWGPRKTIDDAIDDAIAYGRAGSWPTTARFDDDDLARAG
jgi:UDP-glucose 4-epimerase